MPPSHRISTTSGPPALSRAHPLTHPSHPRPRLRFIAYSYSLSLLFSSVSALSELPYIQSITLTPAPPPMSDPRGVGGVLATTAPPPGSVAAPSSLCSFADDDDHDPPPGTKKRKGPVPAAPGSDADIETGRDGADRNPPRSAREDNDSPVPGGLPIRRLPRSTASALAAQRRLLFQKRKGALVALYCDAQGAWEAANQPKTTDKATSNHTRPSLPDVGAFERLLPALEDMTVWAPDAPGWREGDDAARPVARRSAERWRTAFARRKRIRTDRVPIKRGGWAPEGSFELDFPTTGERQRLGKVTKD